MITKIPFKESVAMADKGPAYDCKGIDITCLQNMNNLDMCADVRRDTTSAIATVMH